jgi:hypothetical protein
MVNSVKIGLSVLSVLRVLRVLPFFVFLAFFPREAVDVGHPVVDGPKATSRRRDRPT